RRRQLLPCRPALHEVCPPTLRQGRSCPLCQLWRRTEHELRAQQLVPLVKSQLVDHRYLVVIDLSSDRFGKQAAEGNRVSGGLGGATHKGDGAPRRRFASC